MQITDAVLDEPLDPELLHIEALVLRMFRLVSEGVAIVTEAFLANDRDLARAVVAGDVDIDALQRELESLVEQRLLRTPVLDPAEVRSMISILRIAPELERSGDLVELIALRTPQRLASDLSGHARHLLHDMGGTARVMWHSAADCYGDSDPGLIVELEELDEQLDDLHVQLTVEICKGAVSIPAAIELGLIARFYERLGDHALNIARRVAQRDHA